MAKRRPTIPISHGDADDVRIALADQWQAIERVRAGDPDLRKVQEAISKGGPWRKDSQAKDWVGKPIAKTLNFDLDSKPDKEKVKGQIKAWFKSGALKEYEDEDDKRNKRTFVTVGQWAADDVRIAFTDEQWQAIERAYGQQLDAEVRQQITTVTTQYLKDRGFERAAPKEMALKHIERVHRAAGDLARVLDREVFSASSDELSREQQQSAHSYADGLIRRHLDERRSRITNSALLEVVTGTDGDGNTATTSTGIGDAIFFQDDGPGIAQRAPTVAHDETAGTDADADDTTAAAALFNNVSSDLSPTGYAQNLRDDGQHYVIADGKAIAGPFATDELAWHWIDRNETRETWRWHVVSSTGSSFGADQEGGTTAFSLALSAAGVDSGLDTTDGTSIFLFKEGDLVVGRIGGAAGAAAFAVAINSTSGVVSVAQYASIKHPPPGARDKLHHFRHELKSLVVACDCALNDLSAAEYCDDEPWNWWIQGLTLIAQRHGLTHGARIVEARTERELSRRGAKSPSPFVTLVRALQEHVPAKDRADDALAKAIRRAQGRTRDK